MQCLATCGDCKGVNGRNSRVVTNDANDEPTHDADENLLMKI